MGCTTSNSAAAQPSGKQPETKAFDSDTAALIDSSTADHEPFSASQAAEAVESPDENLQPVLVQQKTYTDHYDYDYGYVTAQDDSAAAAAAFDAGAIAIII